MFRNDPVFQQRARLWMGEKLLSNLEDPPVLDGQKMPKTEEALCAQMMYLKGRRYQILKQDKPNIFTLSKAVDSIRAKAHFVHADCCVLRKQLSSQVEAINKLEASISDRIWEIRDKCGEIVAVGVQEAQRADERGQRMRWMEENSAHKDNMDTTTPFKEEQFTPESPEEFSSSIDDPCLIPVNLFNPPLRPELQLGEMPNAKPPGKRRLVATPSPMHPELCKKLGISPTLFEAPKDDGTDKFARMESMALECSGRMNLFESKLDKMSGLLEQTVIQSAEMLKMEQSQKLRSMVTAGF
eukprot:g13538.t1